MKSNFTYLKMFALALCFLISQTASAQIDVTFNLSRFEGGYNVSCHGGSDGDIEAIAIGDYGPFYYQWSNGATTSSIHNVQAGVYSVTVTDFSNHTKFKTVELFQPNGMTVILNPSVFEGGTNISKNGGSNGVIRSEIHGGTPPYNILWSGGSTKEEIDNLSVGTYSITVTDATNCTSSSSYTLIEPTALHISSITSINHNGFNISCFDGHDGVINLTVAGGIPPYSFQWNKGSFDQNPSGLRDGIYLVRVFDQNGA